MSTNASQNQEDQEIDLSLLTKKVGDFFEGILAGIFNAILFVKKNLKTLGIIFIVGAVLGFVLDKTSNAYDSEIVVSPNFVSTDYLYTKVDLVQSNIKSENIAFLKSIGIQEPEKLTLIEIEPVIDVYSFVNNNVANAANAQNSQNFELVKLLAEDNDINKVIKDRMTSKNYPFHTIHLVTAGKTNDAKLIKPIMDFLNTNEYFEKIRVASIKNINIKMKYNEKMILQIDTLLNKFSSSMSNSQKSDKLIYYNENTQINDLINTKNGFISELGRQRMDLIYLEDFVKKTSSAINFKNTTGLNNKMKFVLPILFIFIFIGYRFFMSFYKKQSSKISNN